MTSFLGLAAAVAEGEAMVTVGSDTALGGRLDSGSGFDTAFGPNAEAAARAGFGTGTGVRTGEPRVEARGDDNEESASTESSDDTGTRVETRFAGRGDDTAGSVVVVGVVFAGLATGTGFRTGETCVAELDGTRIETRGDDTGMDDALSVGAATGAGLAVTGVLVGPTVLVAFGSSFSWSSHLTVCSDK